MKKVKQEIATNTSSGAEKVESIEKEVKKSGGKTTTKTTAFKTAQTVKTPKENSAQGEAALGSEEKKTVKTPTEEKVSAKKINAQSSGSKAEKESAAAKARVAAAIRKKEEKEKRKAEKAERAAKRKEEWEKRIAEHEAMLAKRTAEKKACIEKRAAEKKALAEKRKAEKEEKLRERAHAKANRHQEASRKSKTKTENKRNGEKRDHGTRKREDKGNGYGGWIAAVVALGVTTLALASTVTVGAIEMKRATDNAMSAYRGTMYELTGIMEHVDSDLERVRISASPAQQSRILTDLLVQARLAELDLEKLPISAESDRNVTMFINRTAHECERMLNKIAHDGELSKEDEATLERLYQTNHTVRTELNKLLSEMTDKDFMEYMKKGVGSVADAIGNIEKATMEENRAGSEHEKPKTEGAGTDSRAKEAEASGEHIDATKAEELCLTYFSDYKISEYRCVGETVSRSYAAYNVQGYDDKGTLLFAEISQKDGALIRFDYYEDCQSETFDLQNAERIAEEFLSHMGYADMEVVRLRENGTMTDFTFVYEANGIAYYPDEVHVKVCRSRGVVTAMDAAKYLENHKERTEPSVKLTLESAYGKLSDKLTVESSRLAVVHTLRGERPAYEFLCSYEGENYFLYLDANSGEEIAIVNARGIQ